jgi:arginine N-succinyltransferase
MVVIRPIAPNDLDALLELTTLTGFGLTTLPQDRDFLWKRIRNSLRSFEDMADEPAGESYLFVLEDLANHRLVGTCAIVSKVGGFEPFYAYRIETLVHESTFLGVRKEITVLHLVSEHNGPCEIGSLFLVPEMRGRGDYGRLLSLSRFLFMAEHPRCFNPTVIAELRGVIDDSGRSPFWDALGKHFFEIDYPTADYLSILNKRFIADLMPKYPIYVPLLPEEARKVVGQVHEQTLPALKLLQSEGFRSENMVDIFDAGPVVVCPLQDVRTIRESRKATLSETPAQHVDSRPYVIGNTQRAYRACVGPVETVGEGEVRLTRECAEALHVNAGDSVRFSPLRPDRAAASSGAGNIAEVPENPKPSS